MDGHAHLNELKHKLFQMQLLTFLSFVNYQLYSVNIVKEQGRVNMVAEEEWLQKGKSEDVVLFCKS